MTGSDAFVGINQLYDYIGSVVGQLDTLIDAVRVKEPAPEAPKPKKHFLGIKPMTATPS
jgi:hypothetical protein